MIVHHARLQLAGGDLTVPPRRVAHSLRTRLAARLDDTHTESLSVSPGVCLPTETETQVAGGTECQPDGLPLRPIHSYEDLFRYHDARQAATARGTIPTGGRSEHGTATPSATARTTKTDTVPWFYHTYIDTDCEAIQCQALIDAAEGLHLGDTDGPQVTGIDTQAVNLDGLDYGPLATADTHYLRFTTPYVFHSTAPDTDGRAVNSWLHQPDDLDRRSLTATIDGDRYELQTIGAGQHARYTGTSPIAVAKLGIRGMGLHPEYGFGGVRVWTADSDRRAVAGDHGGHR
jgi:hypothetical protein